MVNVAAGPGLIVLPETYVHTLEDHCRIGDEQLLDSEVTRLCLEERTKALEQQVVNAQCDAELHQWANRNYEAQIAMKWRRAFFILVGIILCAIASLTVTVLIPHWSEIESWFHE